MELIATIVGWFASTFIVFGGVLPYIPQYHDIQKSGNPSGFSTLVCLVLLVANLLRIAFWFGRRFEFPLLLQSVVMILTMLLMLELCVRLARSKEKRRFLDFDLKYFWKWSHFEDYLQFLFLFVAIVALITSYLFASAIYVEFLGVVSLVTEATLGMPQFYHNYTHKSTAGMSIKMVLLWLLGDVFKTVYFVIQQTPFQFWLCGGLQITLDIAILGQVFIYGQSKMKRDV